MSIFSCNEVEEETNVKFEWDYVKRKIQIENGDTSWVIDTSVKYIVDEYTVKKDSNLMLIMGHTTSNDSIVIGLSNGGPTNTVTVGTYTMAGLNKYQLIFFKEQQPLASVDGSVHISYINSRADIEFSSYLSNGYVIENGIAENLDVYLDSIPQ